MNFFKSIFTRMFNDRKMSKMKIMLRAKGQCIAIPGTALPLIAEALSLHTNEDVSITYQELEALNIYTSEDREYVGCCYAYKFQDRYIGALIGTKKIFSCRVQDYCFEKTKRILVPLSTSSTCKYDLLCLLKDDNQTLQPLEVKKTYKEIDKQISNMVFAEMNTFDDALAYCFDLGILEK